MSGHQIEIRVDTRNARVLRAVFLAGAVADAGALVPMMLPSLERRVVAPLTLLVVSGIVVTEVIGAVTGVLDAWRLVPTWCLQVLLLILFAWASIRRTSRMQQVAA